MKIAFNVQPLIDNQKTGIGFCEAGIVRAFVENYHGNYYLFDFFCLNGIAEKENRLKPFRTHETVLNPCKYFSDRLYRLIWNFIPIPYCCFFGTKADVTHFFNFHIPPFVAGKKVCTVHDMGYKAFPETVRLKTKVMLNLGLKRSCKRADKIITISEFSKQEIIKYLQVSPDKIVVAPCGVDRSVFKPITDKQLIGITMQKYHIFKNYFLYLGTLEPRKNIERLIEAYAVLKKENENIPLLVLAGRKGWMYDSIFAKVKALNLEQDVIFTGYIEDDDAPVLLNGAIAFVFPSLYEGFGMPPLEAMACGTPVLTANVSSLPEVVGQAAILVDPYSAQEITRGMKRLMEDEDLRKELSKKGLEQAELFTWESAAQIIMNVYKELVGQGK